MPGPLFVTPAQASRLPLSPSTLARVITGALLAWILALILLFFLGISLEFWGENRGQPPGSALRLAASGAGWIFFAVLAGFLLMSLPAAIRAMGQRQNPPGNATRPAPASPDAATFWSDNRRLFIWGWWS